MKMALASLLVLLASTSHASIPGDWNGWGEWKFDGSGMACHTVHLAFNENANQLVRTAGIFDCDQLSMQLPTLNLTKSGAKLLLDQNPVGDFTDSHYHWIEPYSPTVNVEVFIDRSANHIDYRELWINTSGQQIYDISARLFLHEQ